MVPKRRWRVTYKYSGQYTRPVKKKFWTRRGAEKFKNNLEYVERATLTKVY